MKINTKKIVVASILFLAFLLFGLIIGLSCHSVNKEPEEETVESTTVVDRVAVTPEVETQEETTESETLKDIETVVQEVINGDWGVGQDRIDRLTEAGYNAEEIQNLVDGSMPEPVYYEEVYVENYNYNYSDGNVLNPYIGVVYYNGHKETYYSQRVLPGGGLNIPGRHVAEDGTIRDENGYICVAADPSFLPYGSVVETSLGTGKVYDSGCAYGTVDIYTDW